MGVNPYAAPGVDDQPSHDDTQEHETLPRGAVLLARAHLGLVVCGLLFGGAAALAMRPALWRPEGSGDPEAYGRLFSAHGSTMIFAVMLPCVFGVLGNLVIPEAVRARRVPFAIAGWASLVLWVTADAHLPVADGQPCSGDARRVAPPLRGRSKRAQ